MNQLYDMKTIMMFSGLISLILVLCMLYYSFRNTIYRGFYFWVSASFCHFTGMILLSMRNILPDFLTIVVANPCLVLFYILTTKGLDSFSGIKSVKRLFDLSVLSLMTLLFLYFTYVMPDVNMRIIIFSAAVCMVTLPNILHIKRNLKNVVSQKAGPIHLIYLFSGLWFLFRFLYTLIFEDKIINFLNAGVIHQATIFIESVINIMIVLSLLIITIERLRAGLLESNSSLQKTLDEIKTLQGILPICSSCKKIRNDRGYFEAVEEYISNHSEVQFSHTFCDSCAEKLFPDIYRKVNSAKPDRY